jgi:hypothetical protein
VGAAPAAARPDALDRREASAPTVPPVSKVSEAEPPPAPEELNQIEKGDDANRGVLAVARAPVGAAPAAARPDARDGQKASSPTVLSVRWGESERPQEPDDHAREIDISARAPRPSTGANTEQIGIAAAPPDASAEARAPDDAAPAATPPDAPDARTASDGKKKKKKAANPEAPADAQAPGDAESETPRTKRINARTGTVRGGAHETPKRDAVKPANPEPGAHLLLLSEFPSGLSQRVSEVAGKAGRPLTLTEESWLARQLMPPRESHPRQSWPRCLWRGPTSGTWSASAPRRAGRTGRAGSGRSRATADRD